MMHRSVTPSQLRNVPDFSGKPLFNVGQLAEIGRMPGKTVTVYGFGDQDGPFDVEITVIDGKIRHFRFFDGPAGETVKMATAAEYADALIKEVYQEMADEILSISKRFTTVPETAIIGGGSEDGADAPDVPLSERGFGV